MTYEVALLKPWAIEMGAPRNCLTLIPIDIWGNEQACDSRNFKKHTHIYKNRGVLGLRKQCKIRFGMGDPRNGITQTPIGFWGHKLALYEPSSPAQ